MAMGEMKMAGQLALKVNRPRRHHPSVFWWQVRQRLFYRWREVPLCLFLLLHWALLRFLIPGLNVLHGKLYLQVVRKDGTVIDYGIAGRHLVVTAGKNYVASCFDNTAEPENLKFHGFGLGTGSAVAGDTTLGTELTTQYAVDSTRPTGSQAHLNATYTTVGTLAPDSGGTLAITEWGLFSAASAGTLFDRQVFAAVNLIAANGDTLAATYVLTLS